MRSQLTRPDKSFISRRHHTAHRGTYGAKENKFRGVQRLDKIGHRQVRVLRGAGSVQVSASELAAIRRPRPKPVVYLVPRPLPNIRILDQGWPQVPRNTTRVFRRMRSSFVLMRLLRTFSFVELISSWRNATTPVISTALVDARSLMFPVTGICTIHTQNNWSVP